MRVGTANVYIYLDRCSFYYITLFYLQRTQIYVYTGVSLA